MSDSKPEDQKFQMEANTTHVNADGTLCQYSAVLRCDFGCPACAALRTIKSEPLISKSISNGQMPQDTLVSNHQLLMPTGIKYPGDLFPGTFMPYIDLDADDHASVAIDWGHNPVGKMSLKEGHEAQLRLANNLRWPQKYGKLESIGSFNEMPPSTQNSSLNNDQQPPERLGSTYSQTAQNMDELLPDTQQDPTDSPAAPQSSLDAQQVDELFPSICLFARNPSISSLLDCTNQQLDHLLPGIQISYPTLPLSLSLDTDATAESESASNVNSTLATAQKLTCRERKRIIVPMNRPVNANKAMKAWVAKTYFLLDPFREDDDCWLHPNPPPGHTASNGSLRLCGKIQKAFAWQDERGKHTIVLNFGLVFKLLLNKMNKQQKDGFISKGFHLSHLCSNWTCLDPSHTTIEPGSVNISRNICFSHRSGCGHTPPCMKDKKVFLDADGKQVDPSLLAPDVEGWESRSSTGYADWHDWRHGEDYCEDFMVKDDVEDSASMVAVLTGDNVGSTSNG